MLTSNEHPLFCPASSTQSRPVAPSYRRRVVIVSNRLCDPRHINQAGGLAVAIADVLKSHVRIWAGWSGKISDEAGHAQPKSWRSGGIGLVSTDFTSEERAGYYLGFSNDCLWPLFHCRVDLMHFNRRDLEIYRAVNRRFAGLIGRLTHPSDMIWVHDYHLIPLGRELRKQGLRHRIGFFLHIPFPPPSIARCLPEHQAFFRALFDYNLVGFQTSRDLQHFVDYAVSELGATALPDGCIRLGNRTMSTGVFPVGIDVDAFAASADGSNADNTTQSIARVTNGTKLIIGVDRLDYSKGLPQRLMAYRRLLEIHPEWRRRVTFLQIAAKSRGEVETYADLNQAIDQIVGGINGDFAEIDWSPVHYVRRPVSRYRLAALYRMSHVGLVTPLADGMNLVAKEYVASQDTNDPGVLLLSSFAGAAESMPEALIVNPYDSDAMAEAMHRAIEMPLDSRRARHTALLDKVRRTDAAAWGSRFLSALAALRVRDRSLIPEASWPASTIGQRTQAEPN